MRTKQLVLRCPDKRTVTVPQGDRKLVHHLVKDLYSKQFGDKEYISQNLA